MILSFRMLSLGSVPFRLASMAAALVLLGGIDHARADDEYGRVLSTDGLFLRQRASTRAAIHARPELKTPFRASVDSLSVQVHRGRPQVITDFRDGSTRIEIPAAEHLDYQDAFTYGLWIRLGSTKMVSQTKIVSHAGVSTGKVTLMGDGRRITLMLRYDDDSVAICRTRSEIPVGQWIHLCVTYSRDEGGILYLDGERTPTRHISGETTPRALRSLPEQPIYLGGMDRAFPGRIDDFRIYGRTLDAAEVRRLARGDDVREGLLGHWPLDETQSDTARDLGPWAWPGRVGERVLMGLPGPQGASMGFDRDRELWAQHTRNLQSRISAFTQEVAGRVTVPPPAHPDELLSVLADRRAVLIHFVSDGPEALEAWILDPGAEPFLRRIPLPLSDEWASTLDRLLGELHRGTSSRAGENTYRELARAVAREVWDPLEDAVDGRGEIWLRLTPALHGIPFGALVGRDGRYLVERHAFARCGPVAALAARQGEPRPSLPAPRAVIVANPDFHALGDGNAAALPLASVPGARNRSTGDEPRSCTVEGPPLLGTEREVRGIVPLLERAGFERIEVYDWDTAQEDVLDSLASDADLLHVATHGYQVDTACLPVPPEDPLYLSGVVLAGAMRMVPDGYRGADEGLLSAAEVAELDLSHTRLLVLSGCSTATGEALFDEPLSGLAAAGWLAGARASVATLWPVSDETMPPQIEAFYEAWTRGASHASSLRAALLRGRAMTLEDHGHTHPGAWAALVVEGL